MARYRCRPNNDYLNGLNLDSLNDVSLSDEDKGFNVKVNNASYEINLTDINNEESNDTGNFNNDYDDFNIED